MQVLPTVVQDMRAGSIAHTAFRSVILQSIAGLRAHLAYRLQCRQASHVPSIDEANAVCHQLPPPPPPGAAAGCTQRCVYTPSIAASRTRVALYLTQSQL